MDLDTYDIFHLEYTDNILDTYYKINEYCNPSYVDIHSNGNFNEFFNIIYNNTDVYKSSEIIKNMEKKENELIETDENEYYEEDLY